jgi:phage tail-like protein
MSDLLSTDVVIDDGAVRLSDGAPAPSIFDCDPPECVGLPCCEHAVLQRSCRRILVLTGTGQIRLVLGPYLYTEQSGLKPTQHRCAIGEHQCQPELQWDNTTWQPAGVVAVGRGIGVVDIAARLVHIFDSAGRWLRADDGTSLPSACPWPPGAPKYKSTGTFVSLELDSGLPECEWHRVVLRGSVPSGARVTVSTLTTDADLTEGEVATMDDRWTVAGVDDDPQLDSWDALIAGPKGRYLWLSLRLDCDGAVTPTIDDVEVHFPRRTSVRFLPAVFRSGPDGGSFIDRYLALTDTIRASVTGEIDHLSWDLDPRSAQALPDKDFLGWLGSWIGVTGTEQMPTARRRKLIEQAAKLYRRRGTPDGVARCVALWLGRRTQVLEHYRLRRWAVLDHGRLGDATRLFGAEIVKRLELDEYATIGAFALVDTPTPPRLDPFTYYAHKFTLFVHACPGDDADRLASTAATVVDAVQPAHTASSIAVVLPRMRVGKQASLGMDSVVAGPPEPSRLGGNRLGEGPVVIARDPARGDRPAVGVDARIGTRAAVV